MRCSERAFGLVLFLNLMAVIAPLNAADDSLDLEVTDGWKDGSKASESPRWDARGTGVRFIFPAIKSGGWFNLQRPINAGTWPPRGQRISFMAKGEPAGKVLIRLNEMPGAAEDNHDRHNEFEGHAATFEVGPEWRKIEVSLGDFRVLWRHAASNGKIDLKDITGIGFEPADTSKRLQIEIRDLTVTSGPLSASMLPVSNPVQYRIVFNSDRTGNYEIFGMDTDGRNLDTLTNHAGYDLWPAPGPDGKRIAWMSNRDGNYEVYVMNSDGSEPINLTKHPKSQEGHPTWSPNGKEIAFTSDRDGDMELYVMNADGSNWKRLTEAKASDGLPTWSPDGKQIIFISERDGDHEVYRINVDGTGLTRLTERKGLDTMPAWSPDGKSVAFVSDRDGDQAIFLMDPDGKNVRRISGMKAFEGWPDWSPDGRLLCYHAMLHGHFTICTLEVATGRVEQLTRGRGSNRNPRFLKLVEERTAPPEVPAGGLRVKADVTGWLSSGSAGPNPQKYPFKYTGFGVLKKDQRDALTKTGKVDAVIARALGESLLWPGVGDQLQDIRLENDGKTLTGEAKVLHKYGKQGTHIIVVKLEGTIEMGRLSLRAVKPTISGTWDWGGGIAPQMGEVEIRLEVQETAASVPHAVPERKVEQSEPKKDPPVEKPIKEKPVDKDTVLKLTAKVDGYTQPTQFNPQKYPFKYNGSSSLNADQLKTLAKAGDVPAATREALLCCLLWPGMGDKLQKVTLKSDGKKLTGEVEVLHLYGKQGTHLLKMKVEGAVEDGKVSLKAASPTVSGTWSYGGGDIILKGEVTIVIEAK